MSADRDQAWLDEAFAGGEITHDQYVAWSNAVHIPERIEALFAGVRQLTAAVEALAVAVETRTTALESRIIAIEQFVPSNPPKPSPVVVDYTPEEYREYRTKTGRVLTDEDFARLTEEAERGYDVTREGLNQFRQERLRSAVPAKIPDADIDGFPKDAYHGQIHVADSGRAYIWDVSNDCWLTLPAGSVVHPPDDGGYNGEGWGSLSPKVD